MKHLWRNTFTRFTRLIILILSILLFGACQDSTSLPTTTNASVETKTNSDAILAAQQPVNVFDKFVSENELQPLATTSTANLLTNGEFDEGTAGWTGCSGDTALSITGDSYTDINNDELSRKALKIAQDDCVYQSAEIEAGRTYYLSCYIKANTDSRWTGLGLSFSDENWVKIADAPTATVSNISYQNISPIFQAYRVIATAPINAKYASMWIYNENDIVVDACTLSINNVTAPNKFRRSELENGGFKDIDENYKPLHWTKGCEGDWGINNSYFDAISTVILYNGACIDQSLNTFALNQISDSIYTYTCFTKKTGGYASISIFLNNEVVSQVIPTSNEYQKIEITGTGTPSINSGFVSIYAGDNTTLEVDTCTLYISSIPTPLPPVTEVHLLENSGFTSERFQPSQESWTIGCSGEARAIRYSRTSTTMNLKNGACVDQTLTQSNLEKLKGEEFTFECSYRAEEQGYASISIFINGEAISKTIDTSDNGVTTITGTAPTNLNSVFVSLYSEAEVNISFCKLAVPI